MEHILLDFGKLQKAIKLSTKVKNSAIILTIYRILLPHNLTATIFREKIAGSAKKGNFSCNCSHGIKSIFQKTFKIPAIIRILARS